MTMNPSSQPENKEQTFDEKLAAIIWELTDPSGWDLIGITQAQADALSEQLRSERAKAKQAIKTLILEDVVGEDVDSYVAPTDRLMMHMIGGNIVRNVQRQIINPQKERE